MTYGLPLKGIANGSRLSIPDETDYQKYEAEKQRLLNQKWTPGLYEQKLREIADQFSI